MGQITRKIDTQDETKKVQLCSKYINFKLREGDNVAVFLDTIQGLLDQLAVVGLTYSDTEQMYQLYNSLPASYDSFVQSVANQPGLTLESFQGRLLQEAESIIKRAEVVGKFNPSAVLYAGQNNRYQNRRDHRQRPNPSKFNKNVPRGNPSHPG